MLPLPTAAARRLARLAATLACGVAASTCLHAQSPPVVQHGPFEIVTQPRSISSGTFPNIGGNPFARIQVTEYQVRWRGRTVEVPGLGARFWRVLRLPEAPRPALLLVTKDFTLLTEQDGQLQQLAVHSGSNSLAEAQWLDSAAGQPGPVWSWGLAKTDPLEGSALQGGRWLRLGSRKVLDVKTLSLHAVEPWVPMVPGQPITSLHRASDTARAFSPGATQFVLAGAQTDYARGRGQIFGLLLVDIASGTARELRVERRQMPFDTPDDMDAAWIAHYFEWRRDASGTEQLQPRRGAARLPWRGRITSSEPGVLAYQVPRARPALLDVLRRVVLAQPNAALAPDWVDPTRGIDGRTVRVGECLLGLNASGGPAPQEDFDGRVSVYPATVAGADRTRCGALIRSIGAAMDAELASGRHDALIVLE